MNEILETITCRIGEEIYGFNISDVVGVLKYPELVSALPQSPVYVRGITKYLDKLIPIVDLRILLNLHNLDIRNTYVIVIDINNIIVGCVVDTVLGIDKFIPSQIDLIPDTFKNTQHGDILNCIGKKEQEKLTLIIEGNKLIELITEKY